MFHDDRYFNGFEGGDFFQLLVPLSQLFRNL